MDEPTNHLDVETVAALGNAINKFNVGFFGTFIYKAKQQTTKIISKFKIQGGVVLVSHDEQLIEMVCKELWVAKDRMVTTLEGGLEEYRKQVYKQLQMVA